MPDKNSNITIPQKYLNNIVKMQQDQDKARQEEFSILREYLGQTNILIDRLSSAAITGTNIAEGKKSIPFETGSVTVKTVDPCRDPECKQPPLNPDDYPIEGTINVYALNASRPVQHMTLINDGPGDIHFITAYTRNEFSTREGLLHPNDQRELFNVYEIRLRVTQPLTSYRLIEGVFRTGSFAPATKANVEIRPTVQPNEILKSFAAIFDVDTPTINIISPTIQTFPTLNIINPNLQNPLPPGATAAFTDYDTGITMPFTIPEGYIAEAFSFLDNMSTDHTIRNWLEFVPGTFTLLNGQPVSDRGALFNLQSNLSGQYTTQLVDPTGAPVGGRKSLFTITNDDPFNNMTGSAQALAVLRRLR